MSSAGPISRHTFHRVMLSMFLLCLLPPSGGQLQAVGEEGEGVDIPSYLLEEALREGSIRARIQREYEDIAGLNLRADLSNLDSASNQLFNFRKPNPQSKIDSVCLANSLLEVSKYLIKRLPGTTVDTVRRLQQQKLQTRVCQRLLKEAGDDCAVSRFNQEPTCNVRDIYRTYDGTCNNLRSPRWGASNEPFTRYVRPFYEDGLDEMRGLNRPGRTALPSPRKVSVELSEGGSSRRKPELSITYLVMQFGQILDHDLTHTPESAIRSPDNSVLPFGCCERGIPPSPLEQDRVPDCRPIDLTGDRFFSRLGRRCMRFVRSLVADKGCKLGPREQLNQVTSFLDGSVIYGNTQFLSDVLRDPNSRGKLRVTLPRGGEPTGGTSCPHSFCNSALLPEQRCHAFTTAKCFISGDGRANEQPGLTSLHILFMRVHNSIADDLARINRRWGTETVFQETRRIVTALLQQVVYREFLPVLLGSGPMDHFNLWTETDGYFLGYNETVNPTTPNVFAAAAFRFGHSMVDDVIMQLPTSNLTLLSSFNKPNLLKDPGTRPADVLESLTKPSAQYSDEAFVPTLSNSLFGSPKFPVGFDLYAINIMRGRDHGLGGYNEWRAACGLSRITSFATLSSVMSTKAALKLRSLYKTVDDIDLYPAGLSEHPLGNGILGPTFACLIGQHFHDVKFGDRFWHENIRQPKPFSIAQLRELRNIWFVSLLCHNTNLPAMQPSPFIAVDNIRNPLRSCPTYKRLDLRAWKEGATSTGRPGGQQQGSVPLKPFTQRPMNVTLRPLTIGRPTTTTQAPIEQPSQQQPTRPQQPGQTQPGQPQQPGQTQPGQPQQPGQTQPARPQLPGQTQPNRPQLPGQTQPAKPQLPGQTQPTRPQLPGRPQQQHQDPQQPQPSITQQPGQPQPTRPQQPVDPKQPQSTHPHLPSPPHHQTTTRPIQPVTTTSFPQPSRPHIQPTVRPPLLPSTIWPKPPQPSTIWPKPPQPSTSPPHPHIPAISTGRPPVVGGGYPQPIQPQQPATTTQGPYRPIRPIKPVTGRPIIRPQPGYYPSPILPPFGVRCRAIGVWARLPGMDLWCTNNCYHTGARHCPVTHCRCR